MLRSDNFQKTASGKRITCIARSRWHIITLSQGNESNSNSNSKMSYHDDLEDYYDDNDTVAVSTAPKMTRIMGNSYPVKDQLKAMGCKFEGWAKAWFCPVEKAAAAQAIVDAANPKPASPVASQPAAEAGEATGEHFGTVGEKITEELTCESLRDIETEFNRKKVINTLATFRDSEGRAFKWFTSSLPSGIKEGEAVMITGTVKAHEIYKGERVTALLRCKIEGAPKVEKPTHEITLFCDAKASNDGFAFCDHEGSVIEYGSLLRDMPVDFWPGYHGEQSNSEICAALLAFDFARKVKEAAGLKSLALNFNFDAQWMKGMVGKAKPLRDFAKKHGLSVKMNWIAGTENPADEYTTSSGQIKQDGDISRFAVKIA